jgi:hypothetical protein
VNLKIANIRCRDKTYSVIYPEQDPFRGMRWILLDSSGQYRGNQESPDIIGDLYYVIFCAVFGDRGKPLERLEALPPSALEAAAELAAS